MNLKGLRAKDLLWFSLPSVVSSAFEPLASLVDTALVGRKSTEALAALALATAIFNAITWMFNFLVHASTQSVADYEAQANSSLLRGRIKIALILAVSIGFACSLCLWFPREFLFSLVGGRDELWSEFNSYYSPRVLGHTLTVLSITLLSVLRGLGYLNLVLVMLVLSTAMNIILSWIFLYRLEWGLAGVAYGTIISHLFTVLFAFGVFIRDEKVGLGLLWAKVPSGQWLSFSKKSFNLFGRSFTLTACFFLAARLASQLGVDALGAHQVLLQVWLLASFFLDGLAISGNILCARYYFAGQFKRVFLISRELMKLGAVTGLCFVVFYLVGWDLLTKFFTDDLLVIEQMRKIKYLVILAQVVCAFAYVLDGLLFGLNGFAFLRKHMIIGAVVIFIPLSLLSLWDNKLWWIWFALVTLNTYRSFSGFYFVKKKVISKVRFAA